MIEAWKWQNGIYCALDLSHISIFAESQIVSTTEKDDMSMMKKKWQIQHEKRKRISFNKLALPIA